MHRYSLICIDMHGYANRYPCISMKHTHIAAKQHKQVGGQRALANLVCVVASSQNCTLVLTPSLDLDFEASRSRFWSLQGSINIPKQTRTNAVRQRLTQTSSSLVCPVGLYCSACALLGLRLSVSAWSGLRGWAGQGEERVCRFKGFVWPGERQACRFKGLGRPGERREFADVRG